MPRGRQRSNAKEQASLDWDTAKTIPRTMTLSTRS